MTRRTLPRAVQQQLVADGLMTPDRLTRTARRHPCQCGAWTLAGLTDIGVLARADLIDLDTEGEVNALLDGRETFSAWKLTDLQTRTAFAIRIAPAGSNESKPVLPGHRCGSPAPASWGAPIPPPRRPAPLPEEPTW